MFENSFLPPNDGNRKSSPLDLNAEIVRLYPTIRKTVIKRLNGVDCDCDDVVQDIFLYFLQATKEGKYSGRAGCSTLLYCITDGKIKDALRRKYRDEKLLARIKHNEMEKLMPHAVSVAERQRLKKRFLKNYRQLTAKQRGVIRLYGIEGLSAMEVSAIIGVDYRWIPQFFGLTLSRFRKMFSEKGKRRG